MTTNEKGSSFVFGDKKIDVPANTRVKYDGQNIIMYPNRASTSFTLSNYAGGKSVGIPKNYVVEGNGEFIYTGTGLVVPEGGIATDTALHYSVTNTKASSVFITDNIRNKGAYSNIIIAKDDGLSFIGKDYSIKLNEGNKWVDVGRAPFPATADVSNFAFDVNGVGSLSKNRIDIASGSITLHTASNSHSYLPIINEDLCKSDVTYTANDINEDHGKKPCTFDSLTVSSTNYNQIINTDGSTILENCQKNTNQIQGKSIFDDLTGKAIYWITGKQLYEAGLICTSALIQNLNPASLTCIPREASSACDKCSNICTKIYGLDEDVAIYGGCFNKENLNTNLNNPQLSSFRSDITACINSLKEKGVSGDKIKITVHNKEEIAGPTQVAQSSAPRQGGNKVDPCQTCANACKRDFPKDNGQNCITNTCKLIRGCESI